MLHPLGETHDAAIRDRLASLPNLITLGRLLLVPIIVLMIAGGFWDGACIVFVLAGLSDAADGWLAKTFSLQTELGATLDPLADKALLTSIYATLAVVGVVAAPLAILVVARDLLIVAAIVFSRFVDRPVAIQPLLVSKVNTAMQIGFAAAVIGCKGFAWPLDGWLVSASWGVAVLTLASMAAYLRQWIHHMDF